jgi:anti-sigma regulatory factor (Ser/Thr protein kinase)
VYIQQQMTDLTLRLEGDQTQAKIVRNLIRHWAIEEQLSETGCNDAIFVASELFSNAVSAAEPGTLINVKLSHANDRVEVSVQNVGPPFQPASLDMPPPHGVRGRGLALTRLLGTVSINRRDGCTIVSVLLDD